jgi:hypothetical protein
VIFDLAKPYADVHGAAAVAAAMESGEKRNVRVARPEVAGSPEEAQHAQEDERDDATAARAHK